MGLNSNIVVRNLKRQKIVKDWSSQKPSVIKYRPRSYFLSKTLKITNKQILANPDKTNESKGAKTFRFEQICTYKGKNLLIPIN